MGVVNLEYLFRPRSIAVIGPTTDPRNVGNVVMRNIMGGGFGGPVMPVSTTAEAIAGVLTYKSVPELPKTPDMAVICRPLEETVGILRQLKELGTRSAMLLGPNFSGMEDKEREKLTRDLLEAADVPGMRLLGPKSLGFIVPSLNLNASIAPAQAKPGKTAFISQSDSLFTTVLDWARSHGVGFSHMVALGSRIDVTISDVLDYLGSDPMTRSILVYVENVCDAREFMSAARAAARNKPVLVLRPGMAIDAVYGGCPDSDPECQAIVDDIYDVAFRRAGMLRVDTIDGMFDAARTLVDLKPVRGGRLAIMSNGTSAGILAADALLEDGGKLAELSEETVLAIDDLVKGHWSGTNPVDLPYNATGEDYSRTVQLLLKDKGVDAVLAMHVPFAGLSGEEVASELAKSLKRVKRMVLTTWLGSEGASGARTVFAESGIPSYDTPDNAIRAFQYMVEFQRNQEMLMETPDSLPTDFFPDTAEARKMVSQALNQGRSSLTEPEAKSVLASYGIPAVETRIAVSAREAVIAADELGYPVALKLRSPQISQPYDVGGVLLDLETPEQVWDGAGGILARIARERPDAYIEGFTVQKMGRRPGAHELFLSASVDPVFGPIILFGHGGMVRDMVRDRAVALAPLSMSLARELISRTRIARLLTGSPSLAAADLDDICLTLIQVSQLLIDIPQISSVDINPLYADDLGVLALGATIEVTEYEGDGASRLSIRPYPRELEECVVLKDGSKITIRPIRPEDEPAHREFLASLSDDDLRLRFFGVVRREFDHKDLARFTQIDYDREMAFIAQRQDSRGKPETIGVSRTVTRPDNSSAEFAIVVRSDLKGLGLGSMLFKRSIDYTRERGTARLEGQTMVENAGMQGLGRKFGFAISKDPDDNTLVDMVLDFSAQE